MSAIYRNQLQTAAIAPFAGTFLTNWWATQPGGGAGAIANALFGVPAALSTTQGLVAPPQTIFTGADLHDGVTLVLSDGTGHNRTRLALPAQTSWFQADGETVNPASPSLLLMLAGLVAGGLCAPNGVPLLVLETGQYTRLRPAPWPQEE